MSPWVSPPGGEGLETQLLVQCSDSQIGWKIGGGDSVSGSQKGFIDKTKAMVSPQF